MDERQAKKARTEPPEQNDDVKGFLQSWAWKREHRPDRDRFQRPYVHSLNAPTNGEGPVKLTLEQARFRGAQGFASTVWDSSIVVAKMLERHPGLVSGRAVLDLSAGCGLVAVVAARLGARRTVATDLAPNLPLLRRNCDRNGAAVEVVEHWWGTDTAPLLRGSRRDPAAGTLGGEGVTAEGSGGIDVVVACDVMYVEEAVGPLVASLAGLCGGSYDSSGLQPPPPRDAPAARAADADTASVVGPQRPLAELLPPDPAADAPATAAEADHNTASVTDAGRTQPGDRGTLVIVAHGRNRFAEAAFWRHAAAAGFRAWPVPWDELDPVYRCSDVDVYGMKLVRRQEREATGDPSVGAGAQAASAVEEAGAAQDGAGADGNAMVASLAGRKKEKKRVLPKGNTGGGHRMQIT